MEASRQPGPIIVCLESVRDLPLIVRCGAAMALQLNVGLYLAVILVLPPQRPLDLTDEEDQEAENLLDAAAALAAGSSIVPGEGVWVARNWQEAIQQLARELSASALVIGWRTSGPLHLLDIGRTLLKAIPCPVIMAGQGQASHERPGWPPRWLVDTQLQLSE